MSDVRIEAFGADRPWYRPGSEARVSATVEGGVIVPSRARLTLLDVEREISTVEASVEPRATSQLQLVVRLPETPRHGYGLRLEVLAGDETLAVAMSAIEVLDDAWQSPRHAALTDFRDPAATARATRDLAGWHVNVIQHYDWMWRHYRYRPPDGSRVFSDALGRTVSHAAVRAAVAAGHAAGIVSLAYGSVYGAEREHVDQHPEDQVFDEGGQPLSLGGTFFINDIRPGSAWRERLLSEYVGAVEEFGFDGIHMDTYGPPHSAIAGDGERIEFAALYPGLIDDAAARLDRRLPGTRVLFNCVDGFPLESVAPSATTALYLELWPPDDTFADVVRWIDRARAVAAGRPVVIAAYASTLRDPVAPSQRAAALEASLLLGTIILAAGAYHHTLAEDDRLLVEGYYPAAVTLEPAEVEEMRALWRFSARYVHLLTDPRAALEAPGDLRVRDATGAAVPWSVEPAVGTLWVRQVRTSDGSRVLHLVDLRGQADGRWSGPKRVAGPTTGLWLEWDRAAADVLAASPWSSAGDAAPIDPVDGRHPLPSFRRWLAVVTR